MNNNGLWRIKLIHELYHEYKDPLILECIKLKGWGGACDDDEGAYKHQEGTTGQMDDKKTERKTWEEGTENWE